MCIGVFFSKIPESGWMLKCYSYSIAINSISDKCGHNLGVLFLKFYGCPEMILKKYMEDNKAK